LRFLGPQRPGTLPEYRLEGVPLASVIPGLKRPQFARFCG
jgi:hypothetical protein